MNFTNKTILDFISKNEILSYSQTPFELASGKSSHVYLNWRKVTEQLSSMQELIEIVSPLIKKKFPDIDCFYGVPEGGTKLGLLLQWTFFAEKNTSEITKIPLPMGRAKEKERGPFESRKFLGCPVGKTIVVEDVSTTGQSLLRAIEDLNKLAHCQVVGVIVLTDRDSKGPLGPFLREQGIAYYPLSIADEIIKDNPPPESLKEIIEKEFFYES